MEDEDEDENRDPNIPQHTKKRGKYQRVSNSEVEQICMNYTAKGMSAKEIAELMGKKLSTVETYISKYKKNPNVEEIKPKEKKGGGERWKKFSDEEKKWVVKQTEDHNSKTMVSIREDFKNKWNKDISFSTINKIQKDNHLSTKQLYPEPVERNSPKTIEERYQYVHRVMGRSREDMIFLDESGMGLKIRRGRGKNKIGHKATELRHYRGENRTGSGPHVSIVAAFSPTEGILHYQLRLGSSTARVYGEFMDTLLRHPHFSRSRYIVDDNAKIHSDSKIQEVLDAQAVEHTYDHLPAYSPQLNPIEQVWNQVKMYVKEKIREAEEKRLPMQLDEWIETGLKRITKENCIGYMDEVYRKYGICIDKLPLH